MNKIRKIMTVLFLCQMVIPAVGQPLDSLIREVQLRDPGLQALQLEYESAALAGPRQNQLPDPQFSVGFFALQPETRVGPQWFRAGITQMVPWKGTLQAREDLANSQARQVLPKKESMVLDRILRLHENYLELYQLRRDQEIIRDNRRILVTLESLARGQVEAGSGSLADVLLIQLRLRELDNELALLDNREAIPLAHINSLRARDPASNVVIDDRLQFAAMPWQADSLYQRILVTHPQLRYYEQGQEVSRQAQRLNELDGMPAFGLGIDYLLVTERTDVVDVPGNGKDVLMPRLSVSLPIYRDKYKLKQREEDLRIESLEKKKEETALRLRTRLEEAMALWREADLEYNLYIDQQKVLDAAIRLLETEYSTGEGKLEELLRLQSDRITYNRKILAAIVKSHRATARINSLISE